MGNTSSVSTKAAFRNSTSLSNTANLKTANGAGRGLRNISHWAVDILIKHYSEPHETDRFIESILQLWEKTEGIRSDEDRQRLLNESYLIDSVNQEASNYPKLAQKGEYSAKFLLLLARLLMLQEKTNNPDAYMFKKLLQKLKNHKNIFEIVSTASHTR